MTELPRRPFAEQAPPVDGLDQVRCAARGRRRRRALAVTGGGAGAVTAAVVATVLLTGGSGGLDVLRPVQPAQHMDGVHRRTSAPHHHSAARHAPASRHRSGGAPSAPPDTTRTGSGTGPTEVQSQPKTATTQRSGTTTTTVASGPQLSRYRTSTGIGNGVTVCPGDVSSNGQSAATSTGVGWCVQAIVSRAAGGEQLRFQACRDDTSGGALSFASTREVDLAVRQGGRTVWDWAHDHPGTPGAHQLSAGSGDCWNWSLVWPDVTQSGGSAGHGSFTFVATSTARELAGYAAQKVTFDY